jgi:putative Mg2+ transporter-C (MgtC) family protein
MALPIWEAGLNLLAAAGLGAAIGFERQWRQRLAGLRTNTLVALEPRNRGESHAWP